MIKNYNIFVKINEYLYEKIFTYTKELFELYMERLKLKREDTKNLIKKIKERMMNLVNEQNYIEELMLNFKELKAGYKNEYYLIFCNYMEILNNAGLSKLKGGRFSRYYAKIHLEKVFFGIKKFVEEKDLTIIDSEIKKFYDSQKLINEEELKKINSFAFLVDLYARDKKYIPGGLGFTNINRKIEGFNQKQDPTLEEAQEILDLFQNMADSYEINEKSIGEAYCIANIIKISFENLGITDYDKLEIYIERFEFIMDGKEKENYKWYNEIIKIIEKLKLKNNSKYKL